MNVLPFTRPTLTEDDFAAVRAVLESGWITTGPKAAAFEQALADVLGGGMRVLAFNSGTSALEAALLAADIGPGDEVIVPAMSFVATANVVLRVGARPRFVDVEPRARTLDVTQVAEAIGPRTRAIMPVHFAGRAAELAPLRALAEAHHLWLIEDAAQAIGSTYGGQAIGASGNPVCFSFHPNKNITTIEGGAVALADGPLARRLARIRFHGIEKDAEGEVQVPEWGGKMNLSDVGAALGLAQLPKLADFNARRRALAHGYLERLTPSEWLRLPGDAPGHSWHMFCIELDFAALGCTRAAFIAALAERGIGAGVHYPAMHLFGLYRRLGYGPGDFPQAERIGRQTLTLPLFPGMQMADLDAVCTALEALTQHPPRS
ncbi:DegT/DnrJ/EryC1/StrS family aminotransferase [Rhabdochromatium marinum]|uniref:DegT/DnrJ/EryC1/StrS family aminotransferase n=1 Tax=Rhabdochromatium marinum TaxID=48729 RepID=UPI001903E6EE|nr:DegT/DnrJ/EryC1/StrS family aminotransferase [Rhabdochromatium marinum]MBK1649192.1 aminotransferase DegT [Rhabdochromatium marinum]